MGIYPNLNLFDFCDDYRSLINGKSELQQTPINPTQYSNPDKFTMIPTDSHDGIIEVIMHLDFINKILSDTISNYSEIHSLNLYIPTKILLGSMQRDEPTEDNVFVFQQKVKASVEDCCECRTKGITDKDGKYYYILEANISKIPLIQRINTLRIIIIVSFFLLFIISFILARFITKKLTVRLKKLEEGFNSISTLEDLTIQVTITGKDEIAIMGKQFNRMVTKLRENQEIAIDYEKKKSLVQIAQQVAHDIRSPLSALHAITHPGSSSENR